MGVELGDGSRIAVIGGRPAGSFFAYFLLDFASRMDLVLDVDIYESRDFTRHRRRALTCRCHQTCQRQGARFLPADQSRPSLKAAPVPPSAAASIEKRPPGHYPE
jgi:hypothetical protein